MITFISVTSSLLINRTNTMAYRQEQGQEGDKQQQQQQEFVGPTLCISRTHKNMRDKRIFAVLRQLNLGWVGKIDMVPKKIVEKNPDGTENTKEFVRVFIHFTKWFTNNRQTQQFLERLDSEGFVHIVYDEPWFWKVTKYVPREHKPEPQSRYPKPRIDFGATVRAPVPVPAPPVVPVQVTRRLQNVGAKSVNVSDLYEFQLSWGKLPCEPATSSDSRKKYWETQAETATAAVMAAAKHQSASPTPRSRGSDSESSPSPYFQRNVSVRLFD
jgi:hypothetical protein